MSTVTSAVLLRRLSPYALLSVLALLWLALLSWQPWRMQLAVGGDPLSGRREDDAPYLRGVYASEPAEAWTDAAVRPYRWTRDQLTAAFPGAGSGRYRVTLTVAVNTPDGSPMATVWAGDGWQTALPLPHGSLRRYSWLVRADGTPRLELTSAARPHGTDPRPLGVVLHAVDATSLAGPQLPAAQSAAATLILFGALMGVLQICGLRGRLLLAVLLLSGILYSAAFLLHRTALLPAVTLSAGAAAVTALLLQLPAIRRRGRELQQVTALTAAAVTLRLIGVFHPHAIDSDVGFHANNVLRVALGWLQLTAGLPAEAGGGLSPYPSGFYVLVLPLQLLFGGDDAARRVLVTAAAALLDGSVGLLLWWWLRRQGYSPGAALTAAALCSAPAAQLEALSIGELANVAGQALALPALLAFSGAGHGPRQLLGRLALLTGALLLHSGVTLSVGLMTASLVSVLLLATPLRDRLLLQRLIVGAAAAAVAAFALFYSAPALLALLDRGTAANGGGLPLLTVLGDAVAALFGLQAPPQRALRLAPGLALAALPLIWTAVRPPAADWPTRLVAAALLGALLSSLMLAVAGQSVRWAMFLGPWLAVAAAVLVERWKDRRWIGAAAGLTIALCVGDGLLQWYGFVRDYLH